MHPVLIVFLSIFMPFFFIFLLVGPVYGGAYAGAYLYYGEEVARDALYPEYLYQTYGALWDYWMRHFSAVSWLHFVLPAFGPLALGFVSSIGLMWLFTNYIRGVFTVS